MAPVLCRTSIRDLPDDRRARCNHYTHFQPTWHWSLQLGLKQTLYENAKRNKREQQDRFQL